MKLRLVLLLTLLNCNICYLIANNDNVVVVEGRVVDEVIKRPLPANIIIMWADSTIAANAALKDDGLLRLNIPCNSVILLKIEWTGYESRIITFDFREEKIKYKALGDIGLKEKAISLDEITVRASKIKMVYRGDTVIYNADAFRLSEGSMLDALIEQLPGVELRSNGQIYVNGRYVESLLVNGKDFFSGDPTVALGNLPAYMVNKVKIYDKAPDDMHVVGSTGQKNLALDVQLKKEYSTGLITNMEAAYGSADRYLARIFGMLFTDRIRLGLFGNMNNTNDTRQPGSQGEWNPSWQTLGITDMLLSGVNFQWNNKKETIGLDNTLKVYSENNHKEIVTSGTDFYSAGNTFTRNINRIYNDQLRVLSNNRLYTKGKYYFVDFRPSLDYIHNRIDMSSVSALFNSNPYESYRAASLDSIYMPSYIPQSLVHNVSDENFNTNQEVKVRGYLYTSLKLQHSLDHIVMTINAGYNEKNNNAFQHYFLRYGNNGSGVDKFMNRYQQAGSWQKDLAVQIDYNHALNMERNFILRPKYTYAHNSGNANSHLYRLDWYKDWHPSEKKLGILPSTIDSLANVQDRANSYEQVFYTNHHTPALELERQKQNRMGGKHYKLSLPLKIVSEEIKSQRGNIDTLVNRLTANIEANAEYQIKKFSINDSVPRREYRWSYNFANSAPSLSYSIPYVNDANPLSVYINQSKGLKNTHRHNAKFYYQQYRKYKQRLIETGIEGVVIRNAIANRREYNKVTGVTISSPVSVNGNWQINTFYKMSGSFDETACSSFSHGTTVTYTNSVDYVNVVGDERAPLSVVNNVNIQENLGLGYSMESWSLKVKADATYRYANGNREDFSTIHAIDYNYGIIVDGELPFWGLGLNTDLIMHSRRGYNDVLMNTDNLVWNVRLSKSFLNGNLIFVADGFDILGQLSNIRYTMNVQGIRETWHNVMPRYAMLHAIYRFSKQPKKRI